MAKKFVWNDYGEFDSGHYLYLDDYDIQVIQDIDGLPEWYWYVRSLGIPHVTESFAINDGKAKTCSTAKHEALTALKSYVQNKTANKAKTLGDVQSLIKEINFG